VTPAKIFSICRKTFGRLWHAGLAAAQSYSDISVDISSRKSNMDVGLSTNW
jgi:hypothetical protein